MTGRTLAQVLEEAIPDGTFGGRPSTPPTQSSPAPPPPRPAPAPDPYAAAHVAQLLAALDGAPDTPPRHLRPVPDVPEAV